MKLNWPFSRKKLVKPPYNPQKNYPFCNSYVKLVVRVLRIYPSVLESL
ncbi:hypothetical protein CWATWH0402_1195 [Crocosphaera watsonii WH 0402]|uniref:Uncharacterized protein n=2 Tax=Crocosphaera watsonii TaxID=263511 RepID=T2JNG9_CROWT|nr:hypothetical protein CWATWH0005_2348 [Crocosphaera watsonii WH 0005]CCQ67413.1 hypothetical protein CWATWH0402_1195 [Crocosphaera watsonii WH 0402]